MEMSLNPTNSDYLCNNDYVPSNGTKVNQMTTQQHRPNHPATLFHDNLVQADSLEDFTSRYRRSDRFHMKDETYRAAIMQTHRNELSEYGITWVAGNDSANGKLVAWSPIAGATQ